jgi:hypothetical protein
MANRWAVANGNWSNTATWNGGTLPTSADDVFPNNFTVTVDQNITVNALRSTAATGIVANGNFNFNTAGVTANITTAIVAGTATIITVSAASGTVTINAPSVTVQSLLTGGAITINQTGNCDLNFTCTKLLGVVTNGDGTHVMQKAGTGTLNFIGDAQGGANASAANNGNGLNITNGTVNFTGSAYGGASGAVLGLNFGVRINAGNLNLTGNVVGGNSSGLCCSGTGVATVTGNITGGAANGGAGVTVLGGTFNQIGTATASAFAAALICNFPTTSTVTCTGPFLRNGFIPAIASQMLRINSAYNPYFEFRKSDGTNVTYVDQSTSNFPDVGNVRLGTSYASGLYTGTLNVPTPAQVLAGIPVDNTTGTLLMTPADFWNYLIASGFTAGSIGERLQNASTVATTGGQIASYNI